MGIKLQFRQHDFFAKRNETHGKRSVFLKINFYIEIAILEIHPFRITVNSEKGEAVFPLRIHDEIGDAFAFKVKGVIFDLGYSYTQIKDPKKGLSFESLGELNMKMGINNFSAKEAINNLDEKELDKRSNIIAISAINFFILKLEIDKWLQISRP